MNVKSQNKESLAVAGAGLIAAGIATSIAVEQLKESMELTATEYIIKNHKEMYAFSLSILDYGVTKASDLSNISAFSFSIQSLNPETGKYDNFILLMFVGKGWFNDYGVNTSYTKFKLFNKEEWNKVFTGYCNLAIADPRLKIKNIDAIPTLKRISGKNFKENDTSFVHITDVNGRELSYEIVYFDKNKDFKKLALTKKGLELRDFDVVGIVPFYTLTGDSYLVRDFSYDYKLVYNENSLGLFLKDWGVLTQIGNVSVNKIHEFLNE
jgi:hypothetical protein